MIFSRLQLSGNPNSDFWNFYPQDLHFRRQILAFVTVIIDFVAPLFRYAEKCLVYPLMEKSVLLISGFSTVSHVSLQFQCC